MAAWQPKGAASQSASKTNLANPGTHNATDIVAPAWDAVNGWKFNGSTQVMDTTCVPGTGTTWIVQYASSAGAGSTIGYFNGVSERVEVDGFGGSWVTANGSANIWGSFASAANVALVEGGTVYVNGSAADASGPWSGTETATVCIGARRRVDLSSIDNYESVHVIALAFYNTLLNSTQVAGVAAAMAAL